MGRAGGEAQAEGRQVKVARAQTTWSHGPGERGRSPGERVMSRGRGIWDVPSRTPLMAPRGQVKVVPGSGQRSQLWSRER